MQWQGLACQGVIQPHYRRWFECTKVNEKLTIIRHSEAPLYNSKQNVYFHTIMPGSAYNTVYEIALDQFGYFTTAQARRQGVTTQAIFMMVKRGTIERRSHSVYRVKAIPPSPLDPYMDATLWPSKTQGVISHETALELFEISDVNPAKIHMTVRMKYRTHRDIPVSYVLHYTDLDPSDITSFEGIPITKPAKTIRDCRKTHLGPALTKQAIEDALRKGLITRAEAADLTAEAAMKVASKIAPKG